MSEVATKQPVSITKEAFDRPQNLQVLKQMGASIKQALADAMPDFMRKEAPSLLQALYTECQTQPALLNCTPMSLFAAVIQAGRCGLKIGGALGQCYIIPFKGKATFVPGYKGLIQLVNRSGQVGIINAQTVYDKDEFEVSFGTSPTIKHRRGNYPDATSVHARKSVAFYATCQTKAGAVFESMTRAEAEVHRDRFAMAKKANGEIVGPWRDHFDEMAKKTCIRKLCKYLPMSDTVMHAVAIDEALESGGEAYDASFLFADALPEHAGESESKVDQLRDRVSAATRQPETVTSPPPVEKPEAKTEKIDRLTGLIEQLELLGKDAFPNFLQTHDKLPEDVLNSKAKFRIDWENKIAAEIDRLSK